MRTNSYEGRRFKDKFIGRRFYDKEYMGSFSMKKDETLEHFVKLGKNV